MSDVPELGSPIPLGIISAVAEEQYALDHVPEADAHQITNPDPTERRAAGALDAMSGLIVLPLTQWAMAAAFWLRASSDFQASLARASR